jgi:hypothetical protein
MNNWQIGLQLIKPIEPLSERGKVCKVFPKVTNEEVEQYAALASCGWSCERIGKALRRNPKTVWRYLYGDRRP